MPLPENNILFYWTAPEGVVLFPAVGAGSGAIFEQEAEKT